MKVNLRVVEDTDNFKTEFERAESGGDKQLAQTIAFFWARDMVAIDDLIARLQNRIEEYRFLAAHTRDPGSRATMLEVADNLQLQLNYQLREKYRERNLVK